MGIFFLEFGLRYKKNLTKWQKYKKKQLSLPPKYQDLHKDFKDMSPKPDFQRDPQKHQKIYFMKKVGGKGLHWCCIGESWRKVAEIG